MSEWISSAMKLNGDDNNRDRFVMIMTVRQSRIYKSGV